MVTIYRPRWWLRRSMKHWFFTQHWHGLFSKIFAHPTTIFPTWRTELNLTLINFRYTDNTLHKVNLKIILSTFSQYKHLYFSVRVLSQLCLVFSINYNEHCEAQKPVQEFHSDLEVLCHLILLIYYIQLHVCYKLAQELWTLYTISRMVESFS